MTVSFFRQKASRRSVYILSLSLLLGVLPGVGGSHARAQQREHPDPDAYLWNNRPPNPQLKADILVVVAHPDDEVMAAAYLAREIYDHHKRVAVVFQNPGDGGNNQVGPEQAASLGDTRRIEAREAVGSLGITNVWFLGGHDTFSQNVLYSLEHCGHGRCLEEMVRIIRMTRPYVILTWLPDFTTGENHSDHQAAGVLATEAFDLAGDPTAFSEQVSPASYPDQPVNMTEGLRPWQPEKLYYFYNPTHDIFEGRGPQYSTSEISPSQHVSYATLAARENSFHVTQGGNEIRQMIENHTLGSSHGEIADIVNNPVKFIFGKSLVPSGKTSDVFAGVVPGGIPYRRPPGYEPAIPSKPTVMIGDPWNFYRELWQAHGLEDLTDVVPPEITVHVNGTLYIPLIVDNPLDTPLTIALTTKAADGWKVLPTPPATAPPHSKYFLRVRVEAPSSKLPGWQHFTVSASSGGEVIGTVSIRAELSDGWVAPQ